MGKKQRTKHALSMRAVRLQTLIRDEVNYLLRSEASDPRLQQIVVTWVELSPDGSCARIWFVAPGNDDRCEALEHASAFIRGHLTESLALKRTPELRFRRDPVTQSREFWNDIPTA